MADIDRTKFAYAVAAKLEREGLSFEGASKRHKGVGKALLSRIRHSHTISAANMLIVCKRLELDPFDFLLTEVPNPKTRFGNRDYSDVSTSELVDRLRKKKPAISGGFTCRHT